MDDALLTSRDLVRQLGATKIPLTHIERDLVLRLSSSVSRAADAVALERELVGFIELSLRYASQHDDKAEMEPSHARLAEGFRDTAHRTRVLLDRLTANPSWP